MRRENPLKQLLQEYEKVFLYFANEDIKTEFAKDLHEIGINYPNGGSVFTQTISDRMSVTKDRVAHIAMFAWQAALRPSGVNNYTHPYEDVPMLDYGKLLQGEDGDMRNC